MLLSPVISHYASLDLEELDPSKLHNGCSSLKTKTTRNSNNTCLSKRVRVQLVVISSIGPWWFADVQFL